MFIPLNRAFLSITLLMHEAFDLYFIFYINKHALSLDYSKCANFTIIMHAFPNNCFIFHMLT